MSSSSSSSSSDEDDEVGRRDVHIRRPYRMMQRAKIEHYDDVDFRKYYRMNKNAFCRLLHLVRDDIDGNPARLVSFYFANTFHFIHITVYILVHENYLPRRNYWLWCVWWPLVISSKPRPIILGSRNEQECMQKAAGFAALADFPRCIGAIDCTHVKIISPGGDIVGVFFFSRVFLFVSF